jgi:hypothetical protein
MNLLLRAGASRDEPGLAAGGGVPAGAAAQLAPGRDEACDVSLRSGNPGDPSDRALIAAWGLACAAHAAASRPPRVPLAVVGCTAPQPGLAPAFEAPPV